MAGSDLTSVFSLAMKIFWEVIHQVRLGMNFFFNLFLDRIYSVVLIVLTVC